MHKSRQAGAHADGEGVTGKEELKEKLKEGTGSPGEGIRSESEVSSERTTRCGAEFIDFFFWVSSVNYDVH